MIHTNGLTPTWAPRRSVRSVWSDRLPEKSTSLKSLKTSKTYLRRGPVLSTFFFPTTCSSSAGKFSWQRFFLRWPDTAQRSSAEAKSIFTPNYHALSANVEIGVPRSESPRFSGFLQTLLFALTFRGIWRKLLPVAWPDHQRQKANYYGLPDKSTAH